MRKKHLLILQEIQHSIPAELKQKLIVRQLSTPEMKQMVEIVLAGDPNLPEALEKKVDKDKLKHMYEAGMFSRTEEVVDPEIEKQIDEYLTAEIKKAVDEGRLPKSTGKLKNKAKQYARRNT